jgi:hypothetical protein
MGLPVRMNLVRIVIEQLNTTATVKDADFREPVGVKKYNTTQLVLEGQVNLAAKKTFFVQTPSRTGDTEPTMGHLVFKKKYIDDLGVVLKKGDVIIEVGPAANPTPIDCKIHDVRPESPLRGDFLLLYVDFKWDERKRGSLTK